MLVLMVALPSSLGLNLDMKPNELQQLTTELEHGLQYFKTQVSTTHGLTSRPNNFIFA
jgi:hypothetical protein